MKKLLLSTTALFAMTAMAAAADLPARTMAPAPAPILAAPVFTWTGFYAGIHGGYIWSDADARVGAVGALGAAQLAAGALPARLDLSDDGFMFGGQVGGNVQFGAFVAGLEADISYVDLGRTRAFTGGGPGTGFSLRTTTISSDMEFFGTVRGRVGLAFDRFMIYGTGGLAYAGIDNQATLVSNIVPAGFADLTGGTDDVRLGYAVGVGAEYAFTNNLTLGVEYLYYDLGRENVTFSNAAGNTLTYRVDHTGDIIRGRLNFKF
jgi:outer membrane immunogenic protein